MERGELVALLEYDMIMSSVAIYKQKVLCMNAELLSIIEQETSRQENQINLIASENYTSAAVKTLTGSVLTNKYAEGYPGKRYYAGCDVVDKAEQLAIMYGKKLFGAEHINVQPHCGSQANMAVYFAALKPGDTILGMSLSSGGHLTHGHSVNFSGAWFNSVQYGVERDSEILNYDAILQLAQAHQPKLIIVGASAYSRTIDFAKIREIADTVGALVLADIAHIAGLIAAGIHPSPIGYADFVTSTTHKTLRGPRGGIIMCTNEWAKAIDKAIMPGIQGGPCMNVIAAKAQAFCEALEGDFIEYQKEVVKNAQTMAQTFANLGYRIVSGGTDTHLFTVDLRSQNITGLLAEQVLEKAGITVSRSCIPHDVEKPSVTSGIRIGTPAITTRGIGQEQATEIVYLIDKALQEHTSEAALAQVRAKVAQLCKLFPIDMHYSSQFPGKQKINRSSVASNM